MATVIEAKHLTKRFGDLTAVDRISFKVNAGEVFGFLGPNGAGKSTAINMFTTILEPTSGTAVVCGHDILKEPYEVRSNIGYIPQDTMLESRLSGFENMKFHARLYHVDSKETENRAHELLRLVGLEERAHDLVSTYSGGMRRRLEIIKAFLHKPQLVFMDEPTVGLDTQTRVKIWDYIKGIKNKGEVSVFLTTHYIDEAEYLCDRVAIIDQGKIVELGTPAELKRKVGGENLIALEVEPARTQEFERLILKKLGLQVKSSKYGISVYAKKTDAVQDIISLANKSRIRIRSVSMREPTLEDVFLHYTGRKIREQHAEAYDAILGGGV